MEEFSAVVQTFGNHEKDQLLSCPNTKQQIFNHPNLNQKDIRLYNTSSTNPSDKYKDPHQDSSSHLNQCNTLTQTCFADSALTIPNESRFVGMPSDGFQKISEANSFDNYLHATVSTTTTVADESAFNDLQFRSENNFSTTKQHRLNNSTELQYDTSSFQKVNTNDFDKTPHCAPNSSFLECTDENTKQHHKSANIYSNELNSNFSVPNTSNLESDSTNTDRMSKNNIQSAQQLVNPNLNLSMDSDSSSCDDLIDLEMNDVDGLKGYQDNTSSHSQQSVGGSGSIVGNNGPNSTGNNSSSNGGGGNGGGGGVGSVISANPNSGYISLIPPPVGTTGSTGHGGGGNGEGIDFKHLFEELCPVCGDKVSGYHYGLLTCESCKGFFKRTVQNKKVYTCVAERSCHIDKTQRKRCPYCRFQKCLEVGMKLEAVRADRMRGGRNKFGPMYKRDRARKLQMMRQRQLALQAIRTTMGSSDVKGSMSPTAYQQPYPNMNIKQEIQIPQVSSLTQSPDSSPSPIAIALGQVHPSPGTLSNNLSGSNGSSAASSGNVHESLARNNESSTCQDGAPVNLQHSTDSKICFDSSTNPSSTADSVNNVEPLRVSPMIREFVQSIDDREWQTQLFALLQKQSYNQVEVDLFELMCKVLDQNLFSQVDWARNTVFFKDLKVDDQMKLLQHSWSDMLVLDHLHQRIHNGLPDETQLNNGQLFNLLGLGLLGVPQLSDYFNELQNKLQDLKFDMGDYVCMKFLILLNPNVRGIVNKKTVLEGHENVQAALLDYTLTCYPSVSDKFSRLLNILPEIHAMAARGEEHLYLKHCAGSAPTQTLLMEMLHAKRKV
ncbi:nuclear hormone receptor FTZ-F1 isoform X1 [Eupeodes corollae]|uniref:nuclear hormone receptor FTZ-F1 isoform X1 n=1 Tax=Eupeodes corollae TaxID=290404 RepID=UPI002490D5B9|nr:nuclear hormone receptor FTZ-F1 isoform X1 [Eupeodes corollae]